MISIRFLATNGVLIVLLASVANAQTGGNTGGSGLGGLTGGTTGSSTGSSGTGQGSGNGSGLSGESSFGGTVPGESTAVSNSAESFIGSNATKGFIGGASQTNNQQGSNRQFEAIQNNQSEQSGKQQAGTPREIRTTLRVGFAFATVAQSQITGRLANANAASFGRFIAARPELSEVNVALQSDGVALLTGSVQSAETRRLAANLIRLQPGIRKVDNRITVSVN